MPPGMTERGGIAGRHEERLIALGEEAGDPARGGDRGGEERAAVLSAPRHARAVVEHDGHGRARVGAARLRSAQGRPRERERRTEKDQTPHDKKEDLPQADAPDALPLELLEEPERAEIDGLDLRLLMRWMTSGMSAASAAEQEPRIEESEVQERSPARPAALSSLFLSPGTRREPGRTGWT